MIKRSGTAVQESGDSQVSEGWIRGRTGLREPDMFTLRESMAPEMGYGS